MSTIDRLATEEYISLTTFRRDGTAVASPVWVMSDRDHLYVITGAESGKAKRLRNFSRVMIAPCDMRGTVTGASVDAIAELLDAAGTEKVHQLLGAKYGWKAKVMTAVDRVRRRSTESHRVGIRITLSTPNLGITG